MENVCKTNINVSSKKRIEWIDTAKAILIFLIVFSHTIRNGYLEVFFLSFAIPCFFVLSGITYTRKTIKDDIISRFKRLLVPYFVFGLISVIFYSFAGSKMADSLSIKTADYNFFHNIFGLIYGNWKTGYMNWNTPLYYFPLCFIVGISVNIFENIVYKNNRSNVIRILFITICLIIGYIFRIYNDSICLPFFIESSFIYMSIFEISIICKKYVLKEYKMIIQLTLSAILFIICYRISLDNYPYGNHNYILGKNYFVFVINALLLSTAIILLAKTIKSNYVSSLIGRNTVGILCMHKYPVLFLTAIIPFAKQSILSFPDDNITRNVVAFFISLVSIFLCLLFIYVIMLQYPALLGEKNKRNIFKVKD